MRIQRILRIVRLFTIEQRALIFPMVNMVAKFHKCWQRRDLVSIPFTSLALFGFSKKDEGNDNTLTNKKVLLAKADALYETAEYDKIYNLLNKYRDNNDAEIFWRLSRALYSKSQLASDVEAKKLVFEAYDIIEEALKIDENNWAVHKWMAVLLDTKSGYIGLKERLKNLYKCKDHIVKATQLNPRDATTLYMLGNWCYTVADLSWYQRKIAYAIFSVDPTSSYEEALQYFEAAEKVDPMFYSYNLLFLGKTYLKLQRKDEAIKFLKMAAEFPGKNDEDQKAKLEATKILGTI